MIDCSNCRMSYPEDSLPYRCPKCGGIFDLERLPVLDPSQVEANFPGIWRYRHVFGLPPEAPLVSLGEGQTPLVWGEAAHNFDLSIAYKLEYLSPSGSYKDRGSAVLISFLRSRGVEEAVEDSSGNAGASFAAYAARAGIRGRVYVPDSASGPKRRQIEAYGAEVVRILGPRSNAAQAVQRAAKEGAVYASHAYLPQGLVGYATIAYELVEQLGQAPGTVVVPAGQGNLLLAIGRGFAVLQRAGIIQQMPRLIGVQARNCAPLWAFYTYGMAGMSWVSEGETLAEGVRIKHPVRGDAVLNFLNAHQGEMMAVDEEAILPGRDSLARQGFYVEPTAALVWEALRQLSLRDRADLRQPLVAILTGSGLKSTL